MFNVSTYYLNVLPNIYIKNNNLFFRVMFKLQYQSDIAKLFFVDGKDRANPFTSRYTYFNGCPKIKNRWLEDKIKLEFGRWTEIDIKSNFLLQSTYLITCKFTCQINLSCHISFYKTLRNIPNLRQLYIFPVLKARKKSNL